MYEKGGHFKPHKDIVKEDGMFGTLIIQLPCEYEGASATIQHDGRTETFDLSEDAIKTMKFMAFYADCTDEIHPVTDGVRLTLAYNLISTSPDGMKYKVGNNEKTELNLAEHIAKWPNEEEAELGYMLDHRYSDVSMLKYLKGRDGMIAAALQGVKSAVTGRPLVNMELKTQYRSECSAYDMEENSFEPDNPEIWLLDRGDGWHITGAGTKIKIWEMTDTYCTSTEKTA